MDGSDDPRAGEPQAAASPGAPGQGEDADSRSQDTLAIVALALGIAALVMSAIPFYGVGFALPLGVVALVLGILARRRRPTGKGMATAGAATGGLALVVTSVWLVTMFAPWWGFRSDVTVHTSSESAAESVPPGDSAEVEAPEGDGEPLEVETAPDATAPPADALEDATGEVELSIAGDERHLQLSGCSIGERFGDVRLRGRGPDGRIVLRTSDVSGSGLDVLLVVDLDEDEPRVLTGTRTGSGHRSGPSLSDRRRIEVAGGMRDALDDGRVDVHLVVSCG